MLNDKQMKKILSSVIASTMTQMPITVQTLLTTAREEKLPKAVMKVPDILVDLRQKQLSILDFMNKQSNVKEPQSTVSSDYTCTPCLTGFVPLKLQ